MSQNLNDAMLSSDSTVAAPSLQYRAGQYSDKSAIAKVSQEKNDVDGVLPTAAIMMIFFGPGVAVAFYTSMVGFYTEHFHSCVYYTMMLAAVYVPYPIVIFAQSRFDAYLDEWFGPHRTYMFKVVFMELGIACIAALWAQRGTQTPWGVIGIGCLLGTACSLVSSSGAQLAASLSPLKMVQGQLATQAGALVPVIAFHVTSFKPCSGMTSFAQAISPIVVACTVVSIFLGVLHLTGAGGLEVGYRRLVTDLPDGTPRTPQSGDDLEKVPLCTSEDPAVSPFLPSWTHKWQLTAGVSLFLSAITLGMCAFFGNSAQAQKLALFKLAADVTGRVIALPLRSKAFSTPAAQTPSYKPLGALVVIRMVIFGLICHDLRHSSIPFPVLTVLWCIFFGSDTFCQSFVDVATSAGVRVGQRKTAALHAQLYRFVGQDIGIFVAAAAGIPSVKSDHRWPVPYIVEFDSTCLNF
eukprot:gnl/TRDRNA2_/TRDRNA2_171500_c3_seq1.p1 gnl/TRDRNA2_/TRDRNA2_171500_c3~~gnl/TRDRNA2_/TRDRNA2_171500_c3_seq1.p1  ORF type:complete len:465 (-),score=30.30 gnl/TRDRNA2_/TRDRNA2_171500_c3_seq1:42-1436(-)